MDDDKASHPPVGLVTVLYNSADVLEDFLDSVDSQTFQDFALFVVDNASTDRGLELVNGRSRGNFHVMPNDTNLGVAEGNNQGIRAARAAGCEWVLLINNDTVFDHDFLERLVERAEQNSWPVVTPLIAAIDPPHTVWYGGGHFRWLEGILVEHEHAGERMAGQNQDAVPTNYAPTCCLLVHSAVFDKVGMMDASYFVYFDDVDFMLRLRSAGIPVILDRAVTFTHKVSALTGGADSDFHRYWSSRNWLLLQRKRVANPLYRLYYLLFIAAWQLARVIVRRDSLANAGRRLEGFRDALRADPHDVSVPRR